MAFKTYEIWNAVLAVALCSLLGVASQPSATYHVEPSHNDCSPSSGDHLHGSCLKQIPKLPYSVGVTLSGMDFAAHADNATNQVSGDFPPDDPFTLPSFDEATHYLEDHNLNIIKLPIAWESIQKSPLKNTLNRTRLESYTDVIATMTSQNASVVLTLSTSTERFATFSHGHHDKASPKGLKSESVNHPTVESTNVTNAAFVELWGKLAYRYKNNRRVIFHLMEIPHGSIPPRKWNETIQAAVTNIRSRGARNVIILSSFAPPDNTSTYNTFRDFPKHFESMQDVKNPDGTTDGIVFDLSLTLGPKRDGSERCGGVNATAIVQPVVNFLREHKRQAIVGTLTAPSEDSCTRSLAKIAKDIYLSYPHLAGFVLYGAGAYPENQPWSLIKEGEFDEEHCSEQWIDQPNFRSVTPFFPKKIGATDSTSQL